MPTNRKYLKLSTQAHVKLRIGLKFIKNAYSESTLGPTNMRILLHKLDAIFQYLVYLQDVYIAEIKSRIKNTRGSGNN